MARVGITVPSIDEVHLYFLVLDDAGRVLWGNATGRRLGEARNGSAHTLTDLVHPDHETVAKDLLEEAVNIGQAQRVVRFRDAEASPQYLHVRMTRNQETRRAGPLPAQGSDRILVMQGWDVTDLMQRQQELEVRAFQDPLTGVPNRFAFMARLDQELGMSRVPRPRVAVLFVDVDDFKSVNDLYGHQVGDQVLTELARRLSASIRPGDLLGRLGGDEFAIICADLNGWPALTVVMDRLREVAAEPIPMASGVLRVTISLGAAFAEEVGGQNGAAELIARADHRMFQAKPSARAEVPENAEVSC